MEEEGGGGGGGGEGNRKIGVYIDTAIILVSIKRMCYAN